MGEEIDYKKREKIFGVMFVCVILLFIVISISAYSIGRGELLDPPPEMSLRGRP